MVCMTWLVLDDSLKPTILVEYLLFSMIITISHNKNLDSHLNSWNALKYYYTTAFDQALFRQNCDATSTFHHLETIFSCFSDQ